MSETGALEDEGRRIESESCVIASRRDIEEARSSIAVQATADAFS
jgi:hypothetical protein